MSKMAEAVRFELTNGLPRCRFSRPVHSTALPRFRIHYFTRSTRPGDWGELRPGHLPGLTGKQPPKADLGFHIG